jgi:hypothetical protein
VPAAPLGASHEAAAAQALELPVTLQLGAVASGSTIERVLRVPIAYHDARGEQRTTLEVTLRFQLR